MFYANDHDRSAEFAASRLGADPTGGLSVLDWLSVTGQSVLEVTSRPGVHRPDPHAGGGPGAAGLVSARCRALRAGRGLAAALPVAADGGRTAEAGDELGSRLLSARLAGDLLDAAAAPGWRERENALATTCEVLLSIQREQGQPAPESAVIPFFDRPYRTVDQAVPKGHLAAITDPDVTRLPPMVGSIEQWADSTDVLSSPGRRAALQTAYRAWADAG